MFYESDTSGAVASHCLGVVSVTLELLHHTAGLELAAVEGALEVAARISEPKAQEDPRLSEKDRNFVREWTDRLRHNVRAFPALSDIEGERPSEDDGSPETEPC